VASLLVSRTASAQVVELAGVWAPLMHEDAPERAGGPEVGDYLGLPINDNMRLRGDSWQASLLTMPEHQCKPHPSTYGFRGVGNLRIWNDVDDATQALIKINTQIQWMEQKREIWMDGRAHPPAYAAHTWQGYSTGKYVGGQLVVETDHLKAGWIRRNGLALTDAATMEDRFIRHGETLTHVYIISDPNYLTEPLIKTNGFRLTNQVAVQPYPCESVVEVVRDRGAVPNYLIGKNPYLHEFAGRFKLPYEATRGGAETALPEYAKKIAAGQVK
jgi:hypothetical protein